jgi:hypothetical protein
MMKQKLVIVLIGCFLLASLLVATLYALSNKIVHEPGSFLRQYQKGVAIKSSDLDIKYNTFYIAGISNEQIYLGNVTSPFYLLMTNLSLTDSQHVMISLKNPQNKKLYERSKIKIDFPYFYYTDGTMPGLFRGKLGEWQAYPFMFDSAYFDHAEIIGPSSLAIRTRNLESQNVLGKIQNEAPYIALAPDLLQKQIDGIFDTEGMLRYNKTLHRLIYTYFYRNEYIVYDTNLNLDYRGHTIDTFSRAQIKTGYISSTKTHKLLEEKFVNKASCTSGNYLFIQSGLLAKNDYKKMFDMLDVIDVYDLRSNTYRFSFTVDFYEAEFKLRDFRVYDDKILIALYDHYIVKYDLRSRYFKDDL